MNFFETNLNALQATFPDLAAKLVNQSERPSLRVTPVNDACLGIADSLERYDFFEESKTKNLQPILPNTRLFIFLGFGLGSEVKQLKRWIDAKPNLEILIVEKDLELFRAALKRSDWSAFFASERVHLFIGEGEERLKNLIRNFYSTDNRVTYINAIQVFPHSFLATRHDSYYRFVEKASNEVLDFAWNAYGNSSDDSFMGMKNFLHNLPMVSELPRLKDFKDKFKGVPAIICASGPSLEHEFATLAAIQNRALIFAADSALKPLLDHGIRPHIVSAIERDAIVPEFFRDYHDLSDILLAVCPVVMKDVYDSYRGPKLLVFRDYDYFKLLAEEDELLQIGPTCANMSFTMARLLGCSPIILVGQDLAYDPKTLRSHTKGTIFPERERENKLEDLLAQGYFYVPGNSGEEVLTQGLLHQALQWYENEIAESRVRVINTSKQGARIAETEAKSLADCVQTELTREFHDLRSRLLARSGQISDVKGQRHLQIETQMNWLIQTINENDRELAHLMEVDRTGDSKRVVDTVISAQARAMKICNETPEFKLLIQNTIAPFVMTWQIRLSEKARELGTGAEYCKVAIGFYCDFFLEFNLWAKKIIPLLEPLLASRGSYQGSFGKNQFALGEIRRVQM